MTYKLIERIKSKALEARKDYELFREFESSMSRKSCPATHSLLEKGYVYPQNIRVFSISALSRGKAESFLDTVYMYTRPGIERSKHLKLVGPLLELVI